MRLLENMGIIESRQGSGNYLSSNFDETMTEMLSFMYFVKGMDEQAVTEFRWAIEKAALPLAVERISQEEKDSLKAMLTGLEEAETEDLRIRFDENLHRIIVHACRNGFLISSYEALTGLMNSYIQNMRRKIVEKMDSRNMLESAHNDLAQGVIDGDLTRAVQGLESHYGYINQYRN